MPVPPNETTSARVRGLFADVIELAQVRLELFTVEAREELARLTWLLVFGAFGVVFISFGLIFLAVFLTVLLWEAHRLVALGVFATLFLGAGTVLMALAWGRARQGWRLFAASRDELRRDQERLRA